MTVSVIIPAYNARDTIDATLQSVLAQTYEKLEILVLDDGSTDDTGAMVERLARTDSRIQLIRKPNSGVSKTRALGLSLAKGDFIATLDADDLWHPTKIEKQVNCLKAAPADVAAVYCWSRRIDEGGKVLGSHTGNKSAGYILCRHVYDNVVGNGSCVMARRTLALETGGFGDDARVGHLQSADDHLFQLRLAAKYKFALIEEYLVGYRTMRHSISTNKVRLYNSIKSNLAYIRSRWDEVPNYVYHWSQAASAFDMIGFCVRRKKPLLAIRFFLEALWLDPMMVLDRIRYFCFEKKTREAGLPRSVIGEDFFSVDPKVAVREDEGLHALRMRQLSLIDEQIKAKRYLAVAS